MGLPVPSLSPSMAHVGSLLFPLEVEEAGSGSLDGPSRAELAAQLALLKENLAFLLRPQSIFQSKLLHDVRAYKERLAAEDEEFDVVSLAAQLSNLGYRLHIRNALGGGNGTDAFHNLRHEFLVVQGEGDHEGANFIVEPSFQAQFQISHSTPRYDGLLAMVPSDLVTTRAMLGPLVQLLCAEMQLAFEQHGLSLPPWRQAKSMLSKWLPQKSRDVEPSPSWSPRAVSPEPSFPLLCAAHTATTISSPGCPSPNAGSAAAGPDPGSPRAVLTGASAVLISSQAAAAAAQELAGAKLSKTKSLLSDRLAATQQRQPAQQQGEQSAAPAAPASRLPQRSHSERSGSRTAAAAAPGGGPPALYRVSAGSGIVYRVESEWQEPPIRTVKMQGGVAKERR